jgi:hypothetical protein
MKHHHRARDSPKGPHRFALRGTHPTGHLPCPQADAPSHPHRCRMNSENQRFSERISPPSRCRQPFRGACRCAAILLLVGAITLPSMVLAKLGPSPEAIFLAVVCYATLFLILGPVQLAKDLLIDVALPVGSFVPVRPLKLLLAFGIMIVIVNGVAAMLSRISLPGSFAWLILVGVLLISRCILHRLLRGQKIDCYRGNNEFSSTHTASMPLSDGGART